MAVPRAAAGSPEIGEHIAFYWDRLDHWYEEDDEVFAHARDVRHRVDVLNSSRHVRVIVDGEVVADSHRPRLLFETGLATRYLPARMDVRMDLLSQSGHRHPVPVQGPKRPLQPRPRRPNETRYGLELSLPIPECRRSKT